MTDKKNLLKSLFHLVNADMITLHSIRGDGSSELSYHLTHLDEEVDPGTMDGKFMLDFFADKDICDAHIDLARAFTQRPSLSDIKFLRFIPIKTYNELTAVVAIYKLEAASYWCVEFERFVQTILDSQHCYSYEDSLSGFLRSIEMKDHYTSGHSERVMFFTQMILKNLPGENAETITKAALLHDIGKLTLDITTLNCTKKLTEQQIFHLQQHPVMGHEILLPLQGLSSVLPHVLHHHENYDGSGYPHGLAKKNIPLGSRIVAVVDSFDAMTSDRVYRRSMSIKSAFEELLRFSGSQFDPDIVDIFISTLTRSMNHKQELPAFLQKELQTF